MGMYFQLSDPQLNAAKPAVDFLAIFFHVVVQCFELRCDVLYSTGEADDSITRFIAATEPIEHTLTGDGDDTASSSSNQLDHVYSLITRKHPRRIGRYHQIGIPASR